MQFRCFRLSLASSVAALAVAVATLLYSTTVGHAFEANGQGAEIELFVREGCPHCDEAKTFLRSLLKEQPGLRIVERDVRKDGSALARLRELAKSHGGASVPATLVNGRLILGFSREAGTDRLIRAALAGQLAHSGVAGSTCDTEESLSCTSGNDADSSTPDEPIAVTAFGRTVTLDDIGLPAFTLIVGLLDGFNPCSMWVLLLMLSLLAPLNDRRRMLAIAGTFVLVQGAAYFVFLAAWLNLFLLIGLSRVSQVAIAAIAIVAGLVNIKDFFAFGRGFSLSIPERAKPGIYARMRGILKAENLWAAIGATVVLGLLVQIVELMCTSGFPALFTRILTLRQLDPWSYYGYLVLYIVPYMLDDLLVLGGAVMTLSRHRLQEREGRWLKGVAGLVMIGLGIYLLLDA